MAVIKYSGLVDQLRGKLNGTVFSRFNAGFNTYKKGQPSRWGTQTQQSRRVAMQTLSAYWNTMQPAQRAIWAEIAANTPVHNRLGELVHIAPFQYFAKWSFYRITAGLTYPYIANNTFQPPYNAAAQATIFTASLTSGRYTIDRLRLEFEITQTSLFTMYFLLYISNPIPRADSAYQGTLYYVGLVQRTGGVPVGFQFIWDTLSKLMPSSWHTYDHAWHRVYIRPVAFSSAQEMPLIPVNIQVDYTPPAPQVWPLTWTFPGNDARYTELQPVGGVWRPAGSGVWLASPGENLPGVAADYEFELAMSPNLFGSDTARPKEFDIPRPTLSGTLASKSGSAPYYITPASIANLQSFMNANFSYTSGDGYLYQPTAIRIKNPTTGAWSNWGYSNIWLPIF